MSFKKYLRFIWAPVLLALSITLTSNHEFRFDWKIFLFSLIVLTGHFYSTHGITAKYFKTHNPMIHEYWKAASLAYIPFILSFWIYYLLDTPSEYNFNVEDYTILVLGVLSSAVLFSYLMAKKLVLDLDVILVIILIAVITGGISIWLFSWILLKTDWIF